MIIDFENGWQLGNEFWISGFSDKPLLFCRTTGRKYGQLEAVIVEPGGQAEPAARAILRLAKTAGLTKLKWALVAQFVNRAAISTKARVTQGGRRIRGFGSRHNGTRGAYERSNSKLVR